MLKPEHFKDKLPEIPERDCIPTKIISYDSSGDSNTLQTETQIV